MIRFARAWRADVIERRLMHMARRDAHALVGCSEKKQELKRVLVTFDDKEYVWFASYLLLHFCNTLRMYVVIQSQSKITVLLKGSK
jgi:hypothetical protein